MTLIGNLRLPKGKSTTDYTDKKIRISKYCRVGYDPYLRFITTIAIIASKYPVYPENLSVNRRILVSFWIASSLRILAMTRSFASGAGT